MKRTLFKIVSSTRKYRPFSLPNTNRVLFPYCPVRQRSSVPPTNPLPSSLLLFFHLFSPSNPLHHLEYLCSSELFFYHLSQTKPHIFFNGIFTQEMYPILFNLAAILKHVLSNNSRQYHTNHTWVVHQVESWLRSQVSVPGQKLH